jgi:hypothetical protein
MTTVRVESHSRFELRHYIASAPVTAALLWGSDRRTRPAQAKWPLLNPGKFRNPIKSGVIHKSVCMSTLPEPFP